MQTRQKPIFHSTLLFQKHSQKTTITSCHIIFDPWIVKTEYIFSHFFPLFISVSTLFLFKINLSFSRFVYWFNSSAASIMPSLNIGNDKKSSHGNMYTTKQHICYTVELHCLYKNRSPDDAIVILMIPCFFLKLFLWLIRLIDLQLNLTFPLFFFFSFLNFAKTGSTIFVENMSCHLQTLRLLNPV